MCIYIYTFTTQRYNNFNPSEICKWYRVSTIAISGSRPWFLNFCFRSSFIVSYCLLFYDWRMESIVSRKTWFSIEFCSYFFVLDLYLRNEQKLLANCYLFRNIVTRVIDELLIFILFSKRPIQSCWSSRFVDTFYHFREQLSK